jgi:hypothetical protein
MKDDKHKTKTTNLNSAVVGFAFGVLTIILVVLALKGC